MKRKSTVKFNEKTVYHEYKTNSRIKSNGSEKRNRNLAYGGRGENPGEGTAEYRYKLNFSLLIIVSK